MGVRQRLAGQLLATLTFVPSSSQTTASAYACRIHPTLSRSFWSFSNHSSSCCWGLTDDPHLLFAYLVVVVVVYQRQYECQCQCLCHNDSGSEIGISRSIHTTSVCVLGRTNPQVDPRP